MKRLIQVDAIIFLLFALYLLGGVLYPYESILRRGFQLLILAISLVFFIKTMLIKRKSTVYKAWTALLFLNILGFLFTADFNSKSHVGLILIIFTNSLPFYPIYYLSYKEKIKPRDLLVFFLLILPIAIGSFYFNKAQVMMELSADNIVNNFAYLFVFLLPYTLLFKNRVMAILAIVVLIFFIVQGAKRGAVVLGAIGLLYFCYYQFRTIEKRNLIKGYLIAVLGVSVLAYYTYDFLASNEYLLQRLEVINLQTGEGTSGRNIIYSAILEGWYSSDNFLRLLFGYGFAGSLFLTGGSFAHNDWLELLSNFGLLGISIYIILFITTLKYTLKLKNQEDKLIMLCIITIWFVSTMFSMNYIHGFSFFQSIILAYFLGSTTRKIQFS
ncbi:O-antigen ligase family protein [Pedobacter psychroterrae]|uniref:O-antigen ligase-like membrane protein n=1 Tax=Pedobacter psychroterrae TaxID=2530453 RepID=A0A4R0NR98_9SPHI|nr:hypothetical protein [Pedobacter psychroterrae]TCD02699.1 hypothetical protein EZ437_01545 [Pedobacter psychroterrae]